MQQSFTDPAYTISTDAAKLDLQVIHGYLTQSYWSPGIGRALVEKAIAHSLCFGLYHHQQQIGFARVISDHATFAYLADVFILEAHRGQGLSKWLVSVIQSHPELQGLRRFLLATLDAHGLYRQFGFNALAKPERMMEIVRADLYRQPQQN